jgi:hypothetical protein
MLFDRKQLKQTRQLMRQGDLSEACRLTRQAGLIRSRGGRRIASQLIDRLVDRAGRFSLSGDLAAAWRDLTDASRLATGRQADRVSRETTQLVETTIHQARRRLADGHPGDAAETLQLLSQRQIRDCRADQLDQLCGFIRKAEEQAARGRLNDAIGLLQEAKRLRPELAFLDGRMREFGQQADQLAELTSELRFAMNQSAWQGAEQVSRQILQIAPANQIALDARRRCADRQRQPDRSLLWIRDDNSDDTQRGNNGQKSTHHEQEAIQTDQPAAPQAPEASQAPPVAGMPQQAEAEPSHGDCLRSFMLWIDGVGGFLVCTSPLVTLGRAVPNAGIDIPVQADLRRHHLKIKRVEGQYLASSPGGVEVPAAAGSDWMMLQDRQKLDLGSGVQIRFRQSHPLGRSARVEFISRHRTEPWCDAVLLLGDAILLGPQSADHVYCPDWDDELVIFRRRDSICLRPPGEYEVNGKRCHGDVPLRDGLRVTGDGFSISCEAVQEH